jgi:hypothetical protein
VVLKTVSIPNAKAYGVVEPEQLLSIAEYIEQVMAPAAEPNAPPPRYIFSKTKSTLPANSSLHNKIIIPQFATDAENILPLWLSLQWCGARFSTAVYTR